MLAEPQLAANVKRTKEEKISNVTRVKQQQPEVGQLGMAHRYVEPWRKEPVLAASQQQTQQEPMTAEDGPPLKLANQRWHHEASTVHQTERCDES